jgi:hypothetical protein
LRSAVLEYPGIINIDILFNYLHEQLSLVEGDLFVSSQNIKKIFGCPSEYESVCIVPWVFAFLDGDMLRETPKTWYAALYLCKSNNDTLRVIGQHYLDRYTGEVSEPVRLMRDHIIKPARYYFIVSEILKVIKRRHDLILPYESFIKVSWSNLFWVDFRDELGTPETVKQLADQLVEDVQKSILCSGWKPDLASLLLQDKVVSRIIRNVEDLSMLCKVTQHWSMKSIKLFFCYLSANLNLAKNIVDASDLKALLKFCSTFDVREWDLVLSEIKLSSHDILTFQLKKIKGNIRHAVDIKRKLPNPKRLKRHRSR